MAEGIRAACPSCGRQVTTGLVLHNAEFGAGLGMNVVITCPSCGTVFDPTGGHPGVYDTTPEGRVRLRQAVFEASVAIVSRSASRVEVAAAIQALTTAGVADAAPPEVQAVAGFAALWKWLNDKPAFAAIVIPLLVFAMERAYLNPQPVESPPPVEITIEQRDLIDDLRELIEQAIEQRSSANPATDGKAPK